MDNKEIYKQLTIEINMVFLSEGSWIEKIKSNNPYNYEWAIFQITTA